MLSSSARARAGSHTIHSSSATVSGRFIAGTISQAGPFLYLPSHDSSENVFAADAFARLVDAGPFDDAVGPGEIDMLENAEAALVVLERHYAAHPGRPDNDDLSGLDVALELGADDVERAGFRS